MNDKIKTVDICGHEVSLEKVKSSTRQWYCAYCTIKNSKYLNLGKFADCTYQEGDTFGVDTCYPYLDRRTLVQKRLSAVRQIRGIIEFVDSVLKS